MGMQTRLKFKPEMIISGGQTGADYGALLGAKSVNIKTGGWAPKGYRTEIGNNPDLGITFGLVETDSPDYVQRTKQNVAMSDATVIISGQHAHATGSTLTKQMCITLRKPHLWLTLPHTQISHIYFVEQFFFWANEPLKVINFAGNRESVTRGIQAWVYGFVRELFS